MGALFLTYTYIFTASGSLTVTRTPSRPARVSERVNGAHHFRCDRGRNVGQCTHMFLEMQSFGFAFYKFCQFFVIACNEIYHSFKV